MGFTNKATVSYTRLRASIFCRILGLNLATIDKPQSGCEGVIIHLWGF